MENSEKNFQNSSSTQEELLDQYKEIMEKSTNLTPGLYGWICPKCGAVLAPHVSICPNCQPNRSFEIWCSSGETSHVQQPQYHFTTTSSNTTCTVNIGDKPMKPLNS